MPPRKAAQASKSAPKTRGRKKQEDVPIIEYEKTKCPNCKSDDLVTVKSRLQGTVRNRNHTCRACGAKFKSQEVEEAVKS